MRSGHSEEERPRCQSSSDRTAASAGTTALRSCKERRLLPGSGSSDPSRPFNIQISSKNRKQTCKREVQKEKKQREVIK